MKPGIKTTEFWMAILAIILIAAGTAANLVPGKYSAMISGGTAGLYMVLRFVLKLQGGGDLAASLDALRTDLEDAGREASAKRAEVAK
jgi:hypothetical protein